MSMTMAIFILWIGNAIALSKRRQTLSAQTALRNSLPVAHEINRRSKNEEDNHDDSQKKDVRKLVADRCVAGAGAPSHSAGQIDEKAGPRSQTGDGRGSVSKCLSDRPSSRRGGS